MTGWKDSAVEEKKKKNEKGKPVKCKKECRLRLGGGGTQ